MMMSPIDISLTQPVRIKEGRRRRQENWWKTQKSARALLSDTLRTSGSQPSLKISGTPVEEKKFISVNYF